MLVTGDNYVLSQSRVDTAATNEPRVNYLPPSDGVDEGHEQQKLVNMQPKEQVVA